MADEKGLDSLSLDDLEYTMLVDNPSNILVVDDEDVIRMVFDALLAETGYQVTYADTAEKAMNRVEQDDQVNLLIVDKNLPGQNGLDLMRQVHLIKPDTGFIMITGYASYESAVEALRLGAYDYLEKPFSDLVLVREKIDRALDRQRLLRENDVLAHQLRSVHKDLRSKMSTLALKQGRLDPRQIQQLDQLRDRVGRAARALQDAYTRYTALMDNQMIPKGPGEEIRELLETSWTELSAAMADREGGSTH